LDVFSEVSSNAPAAALNGLAVGAYIATAEAIALEKQFSGSSISAALSKAAIHKQASSLAQKNSFLLSSRVYSKLAGEEDHRWLCRALISLAEGFGESPDKEVGLAWAEAFIYLITASTVPPKIQQESSQSLSQLYARRPDLFANLVLEGLWDHVTETEEKDKEPKAASQNLVQVLKSICLSPKEFESLGGQHSIQDVERQACAMLVIARKDLVPRASWIELCLRMEVDPGSLAQQHEKQLLAEIGLRASLENKVCF
jgi:hypothetical protein